ncbi:MAG: DUF4345 domain-containing protein [Sphingosinicella sp.]|nr:DUF4345 domain-containing protein [Sphingosinicella sp.]
MLYEFERRLLQLAVAIACLVPLSVGLKCLVGGVETIKGVSGAPVDLDSHFRYLSGLLLGLGLAFLSCIPRIEARSSLFRMLASIVVIGGLGRLISIAEFGMPGRGHIFGLAMELAVVPLLALWQVRIARDSAQQGQDFISGSGIVALGD